MKEKEVCRACFSLNKLQNIQKICINTTIPLLEMLQECCSINISKNDGYSQKICLNCIKILHIWYNFKQKCIETQNLLTVSKYIKQVQHLSSIDENNIEKSKDIKNIDYLKHNLDNLELNKELDFKESLKDLIHIKNSFENFQNVHNSSLDSKTIQDKDDILKMRNKLQNNDKKKSFKKKLQNNIKNLIKRTLGDQKNLQINLNELECTNNNGKTCIKCDKEFPTKEKLRLHFNRNHLYEFKCKMCNKIYSRKDKFSDHLITEHGSESSYIKCHECNKTFKLKRYLVRHKLRVHNNARIKYKCQFCQLSYKQQRNLNFHLEASHQDKIDKNYFLCTECGDKCFGRTCKRCYEKSFKQCTICNKSLHPRYLSVHMKIHNNIRAFKCSFCDKSFYQSCNLKSHEETHQGIKKFVCTYCSKKFSQKSHLNEHERIHTGVKPYDCEICGKKFTYKNQIARHVRMHLGERPYKCQMCEKCFYSGSDVTRHVKRNHLNIVEKKKPKKL